MAKIIGKHRPYVKSDKLGRIISIYWGDSNSYTTPEEFKETLNMFRGRQVKTNLADCFAYLKLSLLKREGNKEASEEMTNLHYKWNKSWRATN